MGKSGTLFFSTTLKISENTARYRTGLSIDQSAPRTEEAYLTLTSFLTSEASSGRWAHSTRARRMGWNLGGSEDLRVESAGATVVFRIPPVRCSARFPAAGSLPTH